MSFLSPILLFGLFAAAIPVIIHLLNRRRFRTVKWAAMQFLLKASQESRGKKRLKHILILACRALAIAALIFAIARPLVGGLLGWSGGAPDTVVVILDRSASMELRGGDARPSLRESTLERVAQAAKEAKAGRLVLLDSASGTVQEVPDLDALPLLSSTAPTSTRADIPKPLSTAIDYLNNTKGGRSEIWLASDLQRPDWKPDDTRWQAIRSGLNALATPPKLRILTNAARGQTNNHSLQLLSAVRSGDQLPLDLKLSRLQDSGDTSLPLTISLNGAQSAERISMNGQEARFQKSIPLPDTQKAGHGWIGIPADNNPQDNDAFFAYGHAQAIQSYLVTNGPGEATDALQKAAAPPGYARQECKTLQISEAQRIDWSAASLIIWTAPLPDGPIAARLQEFVTSGGSLLVFPPEKNGSNSLFGISWGELQNSPAEQYFITGQSRRDDGPWRDGADGTALPLKNIQAIKRREIKGEGATLVDWDDKTPLLTRKIEGKGTAVFISTLPDYRWSNLEQTALHLVAVQRLLAKGNEHLHAQNRALAGSEKARPRDGEIRTRLDSAGESDPANADYRAGVYRLGERTIAVNRPASESDPEKINPATLDQILENTDYSLFEEKSDDSSLVKEIWRAFLIAMILFLLAEAILCLQAKSSVATEKLKARAQRGKSEALNTKS